MIYRDRKDRRAATVWPLAAGSVAFLSLSALAAEAEKNPLGGEIDVGAGYVSDDAFRYGRYNGLEERGLYPVINFRLEQQPGWDSGTADYWRLSGDNLGLDSRSLDFRAGSYGERHFAAEYREIATRWSDSGRTVFVNDGSTDLALPGDWTAATTTAGMSGLDGPLDSVAEAVKRKRLSLAYRAHISSDWSLDISYRHEIKDGNRVRYGVIGNTGGNPRAVALPSPIDYTVNELGLQAGYTGGNYHLQFGYQLSLFDNDNRSQRWDNPFSAIGGWDPAAGYPTGEGAIALEPDNHYQSLFTQGHIRLGRSATLNGSLQYAQMRQDEDFLPYTVNPALDVTAPLPRGSLDGKIDIWRLRVGYQQTLSPRLSLRANAGYEDRDNDTPRELYIYVGGDSQDQEGADSSRARYNRPYSHREKTADVALRYRLPKSSTVSGGYKYSGVDRDFSEVAESREDTVTLAFNNRLSQELQWRVQYAREWREPDRYRGERPFFASHSDAYIDSVPENERFENHPLLRKYYLAERDRQKLGGWINWTPAAHFGATLSLNHARDDYDESVLGLERATMQSANLEFSVMDSERFDWVTFFSYERYETEQAGHSFRGFAVTADIADTARGWEFDSEDQVRTAGSTLTVHGVAPRTEMTLGYLLSYATSELETTTGSALTAGPIPEQGDKLIRLSAQFLHRATPALDVLLKLAHETYDAENFSYDGVDVDTMANVIALGRDTQTYSVNWFSLSFRYRF